MVDGEKSDFGTSSSYFGWGKEPDKVLKGTLCARVICANLQGGLAKKWHFTINIHISNRWYCRIMTSIIPIPSGPKLANGKSWKIYHERKCMNPNRKGKWEPVVWILLESMKGILINDQSKSNHAGKQFQVLLKYHWFGAICYTLHPLH